MPALTERGITGAALTRLKTLGLVAIREERVDRDPFEHAVSAIKPHAVATPTADQQAGARTRCCRWRPRRRFTSR